MTFAELLDKGRKSVITVNPEEPDDANELKLVHMTGEAVTKETMEDTEFAMAVDNSYRLKRKVEMYQWCEKVTTEDDRKRYSYDRIWSETRINSSDFYDSYAHSNPHNEWPFVS